jgi:uncharacterized membrane protein
VAGLSELVPGDHKIHAFLWDGSTMQDLGILPGLPWTSATGVNEAGLIVGNVYNTSPTTTAITTTPPLMCFATAGCGTSTS